MKYDWTNTAGGWGLQKAAGDPIYNLKYHGGRERQEQRTTSGRASFRGCDRELRRSVDKDVKWEMKRRGIADLGSMLDLQYGDATWMGSSTLRVREESSSEGYDANLEPRSGPRHQEQRRESNIRYELELKGVAIYEGGKLPFRGFWQGLQENPERNPCRLVTDSTQWDIGELSRIGSKRQRKKSDLPWWRRLF